MFKTTVKPHVKDIIDKTKHHCDEYLEMIENPSALVAEVLAHRVHKLEEYIEYLEKRIESYRS